MPDAKFDVSPEELTIRRAKAFEYLNKARQLHADAERVRRNEHEKREMVTQKSGNYEHKISKCQQLKYSLETQKKALQDDYNISLDKMQHQRAACFALRWLAETHYKRKRTDRYFGALRKAIEHGDIAEEHRKDADRYLQGLRKVEQDIVAIQKDYEAQCLLQRLSFKDAIAKLKTEANDFAGQIIQIEPEICERLSRMNQIVEQNGFDLGEFRRIRS